MLATIVGFHQDDEGQWVATLSCGHTQHMRHNPPWQTRPWTQTVQGRNAQMGASLSCRQCERGVTIDGVEGEAA
jgi:hypothetical protein